MNIPEKNDKKSPIENKRLYGMLGFAMRAGRVIIGSEQVFAAMAKRDRARVLLACYTVDASPAAKKRATTKGEFYGVTTIELPITADELGKLLGKSYAPVTVGIADEGFAREILKALTD